MTTPPWRDDEELLADLKEALAAAGPITDEMRAAGAAALSWRSIDAELELAALVFDSDLDQAQPVRATDSGQPRTLVFERGDRAVQLELSAGGLVGQLAPPSPGEVVVQDAGGHQERLTADEVGMFSLSPAPTRPFRVRATVDRQQLVTDWVNP